MSKHAKMNPASLPSTVKQLTEGQPDLIEITTPSTPGLELKVAHGLGRIPKGYTIVKGPYSVFNHGDSGTDWTDANIYLKFSLTSEAITIAVM